MKEKIQNENEKKERAKNSLSLSSFKMSSGGPFRKFSLSDVSTQNSVKSSVQRGIRGSVVRGEKEEFFFACFSISIDREEEPPSQPRPPLSPLLSLSEKKTFNSESLRALPFARGDGHDRRHHAEEGTGEHREMVGGNDVSSRFFSSSLLASVVSLSLSLSSPPISPPDPAAAHHYFPFVLSNYLNTIRTPALTTSRSLSSTRSRSFSVSATGPGFPRSGCSTSTRI